MSKFIELNRKPVVSDVAGLYFTYDSDVPANNGLYQKNTNQSIPQKLGLEITPKFIDIANPWNFGLQFALDGTITLPGHGLLNLDVLEFTTFIGIIPKGLHLYNEYDVNMLGCSYFVKVITANTFELYLDYGLSTKVTFSTTGSSIAWRKAMNSISIPIDPELEIGIPKQITTILYVNAKTYGTSLGLGFDHNIFPIGSEESLNIFSGVLGMPYGIISTNIKLTRFNDELLIVEPISVKYENNWGESNASPSIDTQLSSVHRGHTDGLVNLRLFSPNNLLAIRSANVIIR